MTARSADTETAEQPRTGTASAAALTIVAAIVALWPFTPVIAAGPWTLTSTIVIVVVTLTGVLVRRWRSGIMEWNVWSLLAQCAAALGMVTLLLMPQGAFLGVIPTGTTFATLNRLGAEALDQVLYGTAPLDDSLGLRTMLALGFASLAILIDQLLAARLALPAVLLVAMVGSVPIIITQGETNLPWVVMLAVLTMFLLRHSIRHSQSLARRASTSTTLGIGAGAIVVALAVTPLLPLSTGWAGAGASTRIDPSLSLGDDLRRPAPFPVMTLATSAASAPYLRIATLSEFDGQTWEPDAGDLTPIADGFGAPEWSADVETVERRTSIRVSGMSGSWLPVPFAATKIVGLSSGWETMLLNRTVTSAELNAAEEDYTVTSVAVEPTREQIQASTATRAAGADVSSLIAETAAEVTAGSASDYDRLIAMQNWFRAQFDYSLEAPVSGDFDGTGVEAVEEFLRVQAGYCIHFSGAFALMAQSLDMQVRIVVGYLPGTLTDRKRGEESIYTVSSDQLHAWPEVHFEGLGWVAFEPTASLGTPTSFRATTPTGSTGTDPDTPESSATPTTAPTRTPEAEDPTGGAATGDADPLAGLNPTPVLLIAAGIVLACLIPALVRIGVRMRRRAHARDGDAAAAWHELRATLTDLQVAVSDAQTPREHGAALIGRGADAEPVQILVDAVEQASYARTASDAGDLSGALDRVLADLRGSVGARDRAVAAVLPRSLFTARPAGAGRPTQPVR